MIKEKLKSLLPNAKTSSTITATESIRKRREWFLKLREFIPYVRGLLTFGGIIWLLIIPWSGLARNTFVSENAIQPAQARTHWDWKDVTIADHYAEEVTRISELPSGEKAELIVKMFQKMGLTSFTQSYKFNELPESINGTNVIAIFPASKTDGSETLVLGASWRSRAVPKESYPINTRGIASVISLAHHFRKYNFWSKDIVFVISDGYLDGMQAFVAAYHNDMTDSKLYAEPLQNQPGPIWAALTLDYPHHSFDALGIYHETANGLLPNFDFISTTTEIIRWVARTPLRLHGAVAEYKLHEMLWWTTATKYFPFLERFSQDVTSYLSNADVLLRSCSFSAFGKPTGPEGLFGRYGIDAIGIFGVPAQGPHGFYAMGMTTESIFRSLNNLLERMHASTFFYLLPAPGRVIALANYLPAPILIGASLTIGAMESWFVAMDKGRKGSDSGRLQLWLALRPILVGFFVRAVFLMATPASWYITYFELVVGVGCIAQVVTMKFSWPCNFGTGNDKVIQEKYNLLIKSMSLFLAGVTVAAMSIINFSAGVVISLLFAATSTSRFPRFSTFIFHPLAIVILMRCINGDSNHVLLWIKRTILESLISNTLLLKCYFAVLDPILMMIWVSRI